MSGYNMLVIVFPEDLKNVTIPLEKYKVEYQGQIWEGYIVAEPSEAEFLQLERYLPEKINEKIREGIIPNGRYRALYSVLDNNNSRVTGKLFVDKGGQVTLLSKEVTKEEESKLYEMAKSAGLIR